LIFYQLRYDTWRLKIILKTLPFWKINQNNTRINDVLLKSEYNRVITFILNKKDPIGNFGNIEETFWALLALYSMNKLDSVNKEKINRFVFNYRSPKGGFFSVSEDFPNVKTTFFAIACLHLLDLDLNEDEKRITFKTLLQFRTKTGLFLHCKDPNCKCRQQPAFMYTFYAIASLVLINYHIKLESDFFEKITNIEFNITNYDTFFFFLTLNLLNIEVRIYDRDLIKIINFFERRTGGFGRIGDTFWVISWLISFNLLNKINIGMLLKNYLNKHKKIDGGYGEEKDTISNLISTSQAIIIQSLLNPYIVKEIEKELYIRLSETTHILIKRISDQYSVDEEHIVAILNMMNSRYKWLKIKLLKFESVFNKFIENLKPEDQKIGKIILKSVYVDGLQKIDLIEMANELKVDEEEITRVVFELVDSNLLYGDLSLAQLQKEPHKLKINYVPKYILMRKEKLPFEDISAEMDSVILIQEQINDAINVINKFSDDFKESIEYLLEIDEVEIANLKIDRLLNSYSVKIRSFDDEIEDKYANIKYFSPDIINEYQDWKKTSQATLKNLKILHDELLTKISYRMKIVNAYNELESFVNFVNENINSFRNKIEVFIAIFYKTCSRNELSLRNQEFIEYLDYMDENFKNITRYVQKKSRELATITKKIKLFKNVIISEDHQFGKRIISSDLKSKLQPFENWLENQWNQKQNDSFRKILEYKSKIHKHQELLNYVNETETVLNSQLKSIDKLEDHEKIYSGTIKFIQNVAKTDKYIYNFIRDTNKILEDFDLVVQDIPIIWSEKIKHFGKKIQHLREKIGKKIIDALEIKKKNEFEENIEHQIQNFIIRINEVDNVQNLNWKKINVSYRELINNQLSLIKQAIFEKNEQIEKDYREKSRKYSRFGELSVLALRKWENFYDSIDEGLLKKENNILNILLVKILFELSTPRTGGRVKLEKLSKIIGLDQNELRKKLKKLEEDFRIDINFIEKTEVIPLTEANKNQLEFEDFVFERTQEFKELNNRLTNFFDTISKRRKILENEESIKSKLADIAEKIVNSDVTLNKKFTNQVNNDYNKYMLKKLEEAKKKSNDTLNFIEMIMNKREEYKDFARFELEKITKKYQDISNITDFEKSENIELFNTEIENFHQLISEFRRSSDEFLKKTSKEIYKFDKYIFDLKEKYQNTIKKLSSELKILSSQKTKNIKKILIKNLKELLSTKIEDYQNEFQTRLIKFETEAYKLKKKKDMDNLNQLIKNYYSETIDFLKETQEEIEKFLKNSEDNYKLNRLKYKYEDVLNSWNLDAIKEALIIYLSLFV